VFTQIRMPQENFLHLFNVETLCSKSKETAFSIGKRRSIYIYTYDVKISGFTRSSIYIYIYIYDSWLRVNNGRKRAVGSKSLRAGRPGIESQWGGGGDFPHPSRPALGHTQPPIQWIPGYFPGVKGPGRGADQRSSTAEVKETVAPYTYAPSVPSWPVLGLTIFYLP
jgi:hypothetical protein